MTATDTRPLPPVPTFPFSMFDPVHLGRDEYGQPVYVNLAERNMLLGGEPGAGKSSGRCGPVVRSWHQPWWSGQHWH